MKVKAPAMLKNKYVLYILLVVALVNVLGYLAMEDYKSLGLFISVGLLSTYFSKNMAVTLLVSILVHSVIFLVLGHNHFGCPILPHFLHIIEGQLSIT